ncbi:PRC-barrel domain-containing protein [Aeribacillus pallidus]|uniref:PRC-barrel domain-containing protein n=1 Tax=Aeribacillus pallidus TaxID=33936 RepID=UPI003D196422
MKKSVEIKGLPIICLSDGTELGKVKSLIVNPEKGSVDFLTVEHQDWQVSVKAIPFKKVIGIGEYAVTVENESAIIDLNEIPIANNLVNKNIRVIDTKVMTRKGQLLGQVTEFFVNDETGEIIGLDMKWGEREAILPASFVSTYGKDIIIVSEEASQHAVDSADQLVQVHEESIGKSQDLNPLEDIRKKQVELLIGKEVAKDLYDANGQLLISKGSVLTKEQIEQAQAAGPVVMVELTMNIKE